MDPNPFTHLLTVDPSVVRSDRQVSYVWTAPLQVCVDPNGIPRRIDPGHKVAIGLHKCDPRGVCALSFSPVVFSSHTETLQVHRREGPRMFVDAEYKRDPTPTEREFIDLAREFSRLAVGLLCCGACAERL